MPLTTADLKNDNARRNNPGLSNVIDQLAVCRDNLPVGTADSVREKFDALIAEVLDVAKKSLPSDADRKAEAEAAAEAAKPQ